MYKYITLPRRARRQLTRASELLSAAVKRADRIQTKLDYICYLLLARRSRACDAGLDSLLDGIRRSQAAHHTRARRFPRRLCTIRTLYY